MIFRLVEFVTDRHLTVVGDARATALFGPLAMTYQVTAAPAGARLVCCVDATARSLPARARLAALTVGDLLMMRKQLLTFKELAESTPG
jgi:hypothetical protein